MNRWRCGVYIQWNTTQPQKEEIWVSSSAMDETGVCYTERSKSEREKQISYLNAYIWNLERWYWWTCLQGRNGDTDVENRLVNTVREGKSGMNGETSINIYTWSYVKWIAGEELLCNTGSPVWLSVMTWKSVMGERRKAQREEISV